MIATKKLREIKRYFNQKNIEKKKKKRKRNCCLLFCFPKTFSVDNRKVKLISFQFVLHGFEVFSIANFHVRLVHHD